MLEHFRDLRALAARAIPPSGGRLLLSMGLAGCGYEGALDASSTIDAIPTDLDGASSDTDADSDADADTDVDTAPLQETADSGGEPCLASVLDRFPRDGETDVYARTDIWFVLSEPDPSATITVTGPDGAVVGGAVTVNDLLVSWIGDPLLPDTAYEARIDHLCGTERTGFTTSDVGLPLGVDPSDRVYAIDLGTGIWVEPVGFGSLLAAQLGANDLLVTPLSVSSPGVELLGAVGSYGAQDPCVPTIPLPTAVWIDPYFELTSPLIPLEFGEVTVEVADVELAGSFSSDGSRIQFGSLRALIDTRPLGPVLSLGSDEDAVCRLIAGFGLACEPCLDATPYCLSVWVDDLEAPSVAGSVVPRTDEVILADPYCP